MQVQLHLHSLPAFKQRHTIHFGSFPQASIERRIQANHFPFLLVQPCEPPDNGFILTQPQKIRERLDTIQYDHTHSHASQSLTLYTLFDNQKPDYVENAYVYQPEGHHDKAIYCFDEVEAIDLRAFTQRLNRQA